MGASDFGYRLARQFGLNVRETRAGLVPFVFSGTARELMERLSGISLYAALSISHVTFADGVLFTHRGLSGPAALQLSSYWEPGSDIRLNLLPEHDAVSLLLEAKVAQPKALMRTVLSAILPRALVLALEPLWWQDSAEVPLAEISGDMECKRQPGLYCIGEVVDVTGHLGGFNFQWAWASAQAAGQVV
jgi:predicted flavoprotein YhiN